MYPWYPRVTALRLFVLCNMGHTHACQRSMQPWVPTLSTSLAIPPRLSTISGNVSRCKWMKVMPIEGPFWVCLNLLSHLKLWPTVSNIATLLLAIFPMVHINHNDTAIWKLCFLKDFSSWLLFYSSSSLGKRKQIDLLCKFRLLQLRVTWNGYANSFWWPWVARVTEEI